MRSRLWTTNLCFKSIGPSSQTSHKGLKTPTINFHLYIECLSKWQSHLNVTYCMLLGNSVNYAADAMWHKREGGEGERDEEIEMERGGKRGRKGGREKGREGGTERERGGEGERERDMEGQRGSEMGEREGEREEERGRKIAGGEGRGEWGVRNLSHPPADRREVSVSARARTSWLCCKCTVVRTQIDQSLVSLTGMNSNWTTAGSTPLVNTDVPAASTHSARTSALWLWNACDNITWVTGHDRLQWQTQAKRSVPIPELIFVRLEISFIWFYIGKKFVYSRCLISNNLIYLNEQ